jgi:valyl-tRNA synthetase
MTMSAVYAPKELESNITQAWADVKVGYVDAQVQANPNLHSTHSILMPPPNLTGVLHAGHAFQHFLMDTISRVHRQNGELNLWQPGVDHAGIQLEGVVDKLFKNGEIPLSDEIKNHEQYPQDIDELPKFLKTYFRQFWLDAAWSKVNTWRDIQQSQATILGDTPDYSKSLFTLDKQAVDMVNYAFIKYWEDGLIYKKSYMINWSVGLQTALSDVPEDIGHETRKDPFVTINYELCYRDDIRNIKPKELNSENGERLTLSVTTVRPETIFSDQFLLVNTEAEYLSDEIKDIFSRNSNIEFFAEIPLQNNVQIYLPINITTDKNEVDPEFGTGVLKVTPTHDPHDYDLFYKYNSMGFNTESFYVEEIKNAYGSPTNRHIGVTRNPFDSSVEKSGKLSQITGKYHGLRVEEGRKEIIKDLIRNGYIKQTKEGSEKLDKYIANYLKLDIETVVERGYSRSNIVWDYEHNVTICERSKTVVEPLISEEFFLDYQKPTSRNGKSLSELAREGISQTSYFPHNFQEMGLNYVDNLHDWCISRDLVWGHSMPIWYNLDTNLNKEISQEQSKMQVQVEKPEGNWVQETKILDTWFSSCLWPLSTLGYLEATQNMSWEDIPERLDNSIKAQEEHDFFKFYSTDEMITAREIFYAWVIRMTMLGKYFTGRVPFKQVVITPTIQDEKGRKMSKSLNNGLDPVEAIESFSSDALRLAMLSGMYPNRNMKMGGNIANTMLEKYRNFGNKLWNVARYLKD